MSQHPSSADETRPDAKLSPATEPGSQSSSGMSSHLDDSLVKALERQKMQRGEPLDISEEDLGTPLGRNPEATTGPVQD